MSTYKVIIYHHISIRKLLFYNEETNQDDHSGAKSTRSKNILMHLKEAYLKSLQKIHKLVNTTVTLEEAVSSSHTRLALM